MDKFMREKRNKKKISKIFRIPFGFMLVRENNCWEKVIAEALMIDRQKTIRGLLKLCKKFKSIRERIAMSKNTPTEVLDELAKDPSKFVRRRVAIHKNTSIKSRIILSEDPENFVRWEIKNLEMARKKGEHNEN
jgi:hypothetical protein